MKRRPECNQERENKSFDLSFFLESTQSRTLAYRREKPHGYKKDISVAHNGCQTRHNHEV